MEAKNSRPQGFLTKKFSRTGQGQREILRLLKRSIGWARGFKNMTQET